MICSFSYNHFRMSSVFFFIHSEFWFEWTDVKTCNSNISKYITKNTLVQYITANATIASSFRKYRVERCSSLQKEESPERHELWIYTRCSDEVVLSNSLLHLVYIHNFSSFWRLLQRYHCDVTTFVRFEPALTLLDVLFRRALNVLSVNVLRWKMTQSFYNKLLN